jgi:hypothetical protein
MKTKTKAKTKTVRATTALKNRIQEYYRRLNARDFQWCYRAIDPAIRNQATSVTFLQFASSLARFLDNYSSVGVRPNGIDIQLHQNEPNSLYENRDFAVVRVLWHDGTGGLRHFHDRWVRNGRSWYSRTTGLVTHEAKT